MSPQCTDEDRFRAKVSGTPACKNIASTECATEISTASTLYGAGCLLLQTTPEQGSPTYSSLVCENASGVLRTQCDLANTPGGAGIPRAADTPGGAGTPRPADTPGGAGWATAGAVLGMIGTATGLGFGAVQTKRAMDFQRQARSAQNEAGESQLRSQNYQAD